MGLIINILAIVDKYVVFEYHNKKYISYLENIGVFKLFFVKVFYDFKRFAISATTPLWNHYAF